MKTAVYCPVEPVNAEREIEILYLRQNAKKSRPEAHGFTHSNNLACLSTIFRPVDYDGDYSDYRQSIFRDFATAVSCFNLSALELAVLIADRAEFVRHIRIAR